MTERSSGDWQRLRLEDRLQPGVRILFVGINPGMRSAQTGHHFAGYSNRFWRLLCESALVPERIGYADDARLPEWGLGITNLVARPSRGIDDLRREEYRQGWAALRRKILRCRPEIVALVGVTLYRALLPFMTPSKGARSRVPRAATGPQPYAMLSARVFVLPNPSGRNANFSYAEMLASFRALRRERDKGLERRERAELAGGKRGKESAILGHVDSSVARDRGGDGPGSGR